MSKSDYPYEYKKFKGEIDSEFDLIWSPQKYFQFAKKSLREAYEQNPHIEWYLTERSRDLYARGRRPHQYKAPVDWAGQGYPFLIKFVESRGKVVGIINLVPACNKDDNLDGKDAEGKAFSYNGVTFDLQANAQLGTGGTGIIHWKIKEKLKEIDSKLYSGKGDEIAGGALKGSKNVIGEYRTVSNNYNKKNIFLNPVFTLLNCETLKEFTYFERVIPLILSEPILDYLINELPLNPGQERAVTVDARKIEGKMIGATLKWEKFTAQELKQAIQERLIYFASRPHIKRNTLNVPLLIRGYQDQKIAIDVNFKDSHGRTALSYAFETNHTSIIESLIEHGADLCVEDENKKTPVDYNPGIPKYLLTEYTWENPTIKAVFVQKYQEYQQKKSEPSCRVSQNSYSFIPTPTPTPTPEQNTIATPSP